MEPDNMNKYMIISGGRVDLQSLQGLMDRHMGCYDNCGNCNDRDDCDDCKIIAVDKGLEICNKIGLTPDVIVGDFDSASSAVVGMYRRIAKKKKSIEFLDLDTHKDLTDTHVALQYALDHKASEIYISGATGTRMDHTMANIGLLKICADHNVKAYIEDDNNIITMIKGSEKLSRIEGYDYVSLIPYGGAVADVTLTGFEYDVSNYTFEIGDSRGVSNSISEDEASIEYESGYMIVVYSRD